MSYELCWIFCILLMYFFVHKKEEKKATPPNYANVLPAAQAALAPPRFVFLILLVRFSNMFLPFFISIARKQTYAFVDFWRLFCSFSFEKFKINFSVFSVHINIVGDAQTHFNSNLENVDTVCFLYEKIMCLCLQHRRLTT